jgi:hypothetical protein
LPGNEQIGRGLRVQEVDRNFGKRYGTLIRKQSTESDSGVGLVATMHKKTVTEQSKIMKQSEWTLNCSSDCLLDRCKLPNSGEKCEVQLLEHSYLTTLYSIINLQETMTLCYEEIGN